MTPLLTIAIPTYCREDHLGKLLEVLKVELLHLDDVVEVLISDNASPDDTLQKCANFVREVPLARVVRNEENIGAERNMVQCMSMARGEYVWIFGDDDLPKQGILLKVVEMLRAERPSLVVMASEWHNQLTSSAQGSAVTALHPQRLAKLDFARATNVWLTFISGIIVSRAALSQGPNLVDPARFVGTGLVSLGWVLPALEKGEGLIRITEPCVLATGGNSGGYAALKVFGVNFSQVTKNFFCERSPCYRAIIGMTVIGNLPQLVWNMRVGTAGKFSAEFPWDEMRREIGGFVGYWALIIPIGRAPKPIARFALLAARVVAKVQRICAR